jgi:hypothetical protein
MPAPQIVAITVLYPAGQSSIAPGETAEVWVDAVDSDNYTIDVTVTVKDQAGNPVTGGVAVIAADGLTYTAVASAVSGPQPTITQHPTERNRFFVTAG